MSTKVLPGLVLLFLAACTSSTDVVSGGGQAASKQEASAAFSAADVGEYELTTPSIDATLTLSSVAPFTFDLSAVRQTGGHNFGELADAKATIVNGEAVFEQGDDCTITIAKAGDDLDVAQEGLCTDAGFGAFVDVSGTYRRKQSTFSAVDVGAYELTTPSIDATLTLSSAAPFTFDLSAVRQTGGRNFGELADAKATIVNGEAVFEQGDDCTITIAKAGDDLDVAQEGLCTDAGFGAFVDVSGRYVRVR